MQRTFALIIEGRGFDSKVAASVGESFLDSECVSCGACIQVCPTATLMEKSIIDHGLPEHSVITTASRKGDITLRATITERVPPGVVYTTFHNPETGANVVTTEYSDWATDCPEYKVTAVQVAPAVHHSKWQRTFEDRARSQGKILDTL